jgi:hypothetical protein
MQCCGDTAQMRCCCAAAGAHVRVALCVLRTCGLAAMAAIARACAMRAPALGHSKGTADA